MTNRPPEAFEDPHIRSVMLELEQMLEAFALRKRKPDDIAEEDAVLDMYKSALGMV